MASYPRLMQISSRPFASSARPAYEPKVWAPDAVLSPPLGYPSDEAPASLLGGLIIAQKIAEQEANACTHPPYEPKVWAPDAVLAPPPGYQSEKTNAPETVSFFGVELPLESFGLIHQRSSQGYSLY